MWTVECVVPARLEKEKNDAKGLDRAEASCNLRALRHVWRADGPDWAVKFYLCPRNLADSDLLSTLDFGHFQGAVCRLLGRIGNGQNVVLFFFLFFLFGLSSCRGLLYRSLSSLLPSGW